MAVSATTDRRTRIRTRATTLPADLFVGPTLLAGPANVVMQLSHPAVGRGVVESTVSSGKLSRHPVKRTRTTLTYLAVSLGGSEDERRRFRREVNRQHAPVRSGTSSPVRYSAFDHDLQLWVAACLYKGMQDSREALGIPMTTARADALYRRAVRLGSTLQMPEDAWPEDREAFERYWKRSLERVSLDPEVREHLLHITGLGFLPAPLRVTLGPALRFVTTGFLPQRFREELGLPWGPHHQRHFDRRLGPAAVVHRRTASADRQPHVV